MAARLIAPPMALTAGPLLCQSRPALNLNQAWRARDELAWRVTFCSALPDQWTKRESLCSGPDAKRFDSRLIKLGDLGFGAFGRVERLPMAPSAHSQCVSSAAADSASMTYTRRP
ncbi:hypothetical protein ACRE_030920 [Hapsidospora chrysogenum ATCC 11550]|uniref:Uncharacterized protein n=1 Tax=Hapsidospora chrysogenum (strain ATCC 11550 / CBS 779.69 / DSM 880 / IAM 14645 / JCM 23072 / IMI 49137) TaxID=857340 RepID=A0A086T9P9_HAPC1|nr:hypothetical protein ACRE_030920 [Hapsidospora chrysogenum ATCC 11550]